jgi:6-phosphogluconolactonase/glucosamine-6-phosphate isomerase/deaminase
VLMLGTGMYPASIYIQLCHTLHLKLNHDLDGMSCDEYDIARNRYGSYVWSFSSLAAGLEITSTGPDGHLASLKAEHMNNKHTTAA